jgi:hypothetical protein
MEEGGGKGEGDQAGRRGRKLTGKVEEEEEEDEGASEVTESDDDGGASKKGNETNDGDQGKDSGPKESAAIGEAAGTGAPKTRKSVNKDKVDEAEEEEAADASDSEEDS